MDQIDNINENRDPLEILEVVTKKPKKVRRNPSSWKGNERKRKKAEGDCCQ